MITVFNMVKKLSSNVYIPFQGLLIKKKFPWRWEILFLLPQINLGIYLCQWLAWENEVKSGSLIRNRIRSVSLKRKSEKPVAGLVETVHIFLQCVWTDKERWEKHRASRHLLHEQLCCFANLGLVWNFALSYWDPTQMWIVWITWSHLVLIGECELNLNLVSKHKLKLY